MALIKCAECSREISSSARSCPGCGAKVPKLKLWLWIPLAAVGAFLAFGAMQPQYMSEARELREACEQMIGRDLTRQRECDRIYDRAIAQGKAEAQK